MHVPNGIPSWAKALLGPATVLATCVEGKRLDRKKAGINIDDLQEDIKMEEERREKWLKPTAASIKARMLLSAAGKTFTFEVNPIFLGKTAAGKPELGGKAFGFYRLAQEGATEIAPEEFQETFETEKLELKKGGTLVIGFTIEPTEKDLEHVEQYVPDLVHESLESTLGRDVGWTIGTFGHGRYIAPSGETFDERSTTVTIRGVDSEELQQAGKGLLEQLGQQAILVMDDTNKNTYLLSRKG